MPQDGIAKMKKNFSENEKPLLTVMVQAKTPERIKELIDKSIPQGAEAFGMQFEQLDEKYKTEAVYRDLFSYAKGIPTYATNYRGGSNDGKTDDELAEELLKIADYGAELCDVMGDYFDRQPEEVAVDEKAIQKQIAFIDKLHRVGAKVLMSSHIMKFTSPERVLEIAQQHKRVGADISKIVVGADKMEQQIENLRIINMLKENLDIPFLFLSGGECKILRRIGGELGCCMYLCVCEHDELATPVQPLLSDMKTIRDIMRIG